MKQTLLFFAALLAAATMQAQAQVLFSIPNVTFQAGDTVRAQFYVSNFNGVGAFQFAMKHDTAALKYLSVAAPLEFTGAIPNLGNSSFSWYGKPGYNLTPGELRCGWYKATGASVTDGTHCFSVVFKAKTSGNLASDFWLWTNHPTLKPAAYKAIPITSVGLNIAYTEQGETVAASEPKAGEEASAFPNPFSDSFTLDLPKTAQQVTVYDATCSRVYFASDVAAGQYEITLADALAGVYFLQILTTDGTTARQIVKE